MMKQFMAQNGGQNGNTRQSISGGNASTGNTGNKRQSISGANGMRQSMMGDLAGARPSMIAQMMGDAKNDDNSTDKRRQSMMGQMMGCDPMMMMMQNMMGFENGGMMGNDMM